MINELNKQRIIDGVNVSYCPNHYNGWSALHKDNRPMCDCGYDTECKPKYFKCSYYVKCLEKQLKRKEQECEELKKEIAFGNNGTLSDKIRAMVFKDLNKENNKLSKTLADIKEIAEKHKVTAHCDYLIDIEQILQQISKVENEN